MPGYSRILLTHTDGDGGRDRSGRKSNTQHELGLSGEAALTHQLLWIKQSKGDSQNIGTSEGAGTRSWENAGQDSLLSSFLSYFSPFFLFLSFLFSLSLSLSLPPPLPPLQDLSVFSFTDNVLSVHFTAAYISSNLS